jgi:hypothetical protein
MCGLIPVPQEEDPETYQTHFASYIANDLDGDSLEDKYKEVGDRSLPSCAGAITQLQRRQPHPRCSVMPDWPWHALPYGSASG